MNTFQLSCFLAVAEYLNFAKAAQSLHVTHPAVSQQIQSLERELSVKLFQRTTRSVKLTEAGEAFLNDARQMVAISERAKKRFSSADARSIETLSLGFYNFPCLFLLSDALAQLRTDRPALHPRLQVIPFQHIYRLLEEGDLDAVVGFKETSAVKISALYRELTKAPVVCVCPSRHPLAGRTAVTPEDLKQERLVLLVPPRISRLSPTCRDSLWGNVRPLRSISVNRRRRSRPWSQRGTEFPSCRICSSPRCRGSPASRWRASPRFPSGFTISRCRGSRR